MLPLGTGSARRPVVRALGVGGGGCNIARESGLIALTIGTSRDRVPGGGEHLVLTDEDVRFIGTTEPRTLIGLGTWWAKRVAEFIEEADLVHVFCGLGGATGSYLAPIVAAIARKRAHLVVSSVTLPFEVEAESRRSLANRALASVRSASDMTVVYENDRLLDLAPDLPMQRAFEVMNRIMTVPQAELSRVITVSDLDNIRGDFSTCRTVRFGYGSASGRDRESRVLREALSSPWFDVDPYEVRSAIVLLFASDLDDVDLRPLASDIGGMMGDARIRFAAREGDEGDRLRAIMLLGS